MTLNNLLTKLILPNVYISRYDIYDYQHKLILQDSSLDDFVKVFGDCEILDYETYSLGKIINNNQSIDIIVVQIKLNCYIGR
jgi:hypothetical protein